MRDEARAFFSTCLLAEASFRGQRLLPGKTCTASLTSLVGAADALSSGRKPPTHREPPEPPYSRSGFHMSKHRCAPEHPLSEARGELLRHWRPPGPPFPLPWQPRTAGEECRGPGTSGEGAHMPPSHESTNPGFTPLQLTAAARDVPAARQGKLQLALAVTESRSAAAGVLSQGRRGNPRKKKGNPQMSRIPGEGKGLTHLAFTF